MTLKTAFLWGMVISLALAALLGVAAVIFGGLGSQTERLILTSLNVGLFSLPCLACAIVLERRRAVPLMWLGIVMSLASLAVWLLAIWRVFGWSHEETVVRCAAAGTVISLWATHWGLMILPPLRVHYARVIRVATLGFAGLVAALVMVLIIDEDLVDDWDELYQRTLAVASILGACGTVVTPVLALVEWLKHKDERVALGGKIRVELTCPRCGATQTVRTGVGHCSSCRLRIAVEIEEPRCPCGYPVYKLEGDACPECGREIDEAMRWTKASTTSDATLES